jgi:hypothetical protein
MPFALNFVHPLLMWVLLGLMLYSGYLGFKASLIRKVSAEERKAMVPLHYGQRHTQLGAVILGLAETYGLAYAPTYSVVFTFLILIGVLAFRPRGILGKPA